MTKAKSNVMTDFVAPIAVLVIICVVMSALLALTNSATAPIIAEAERKANEEARLEVLPDADSFLQVEQAGLPDAVKEVYQAENGVGYTFSLTTQGYGGKNTLKMAVGIDMDGKITGVKVLSHKETPGLGSKVTTEESFYGSPDWTPPGPPPPTLSPARPSPPTTTRPPSPTRSPRSTW